MANSVKAEESPKFDTLSDLGKYHLGMNASSSSQFKLPTFSSSIGKAGGGFVLPKLGNLSISPSRPVNSLSLYDFSKSQTDKKSCFTIPNLFPSNSKPADELKTEPEKMLIDLKSALVPDIEQKKIARAAKSEVKHEVEVFVPQFIDCDNTINIRIKDLTIDDHCERLTLKELKSRFKGHSLKKLSIVGKILGRKFKKKVPQIRHGYTAIHNINRFTFDTPSPDDKILAHLNKNKK